MFFMRQNSSFDSIMYPYLVVKNIIMLTLIVKKKILWIFLFNS